MFEEKIKEAIAKATDLKKPEIKIVEPFGIAKQFGDLSFACFELAKKQKTNPKEVATELAAKLKKKLPNEITDVKVVGGYLNFLLNKSIFLKKTIEQISKEKDKYGSVNIKKTKALIEHTSINPNASPHVGRIRNAIIGDILTRLLRFHGYNTEVHFYVNDVSKQIALMLLEFKGTETFDKLLGLYVRMSAELEKKPELEKQVFAMIEQIEAQDKETIERMNKLVGICIEGQKKILEQLGIYYDSFDHESIYINMMDKILKQLKKTGRLKKDLEGRYYLDQSNMSWQFEKEMKSPIFVLTRSNGTGLYPLRDMAYTIDKLKSAPINIIVLGEDQKLYFKQFSAALDLLGYRAPRVVHYSYILLETKKGTKKMSTRRGEIILVEDFIKEAIDKAKAEIKKRKREKIVSLETAKAIGIGAVRYTIARVEQNKTVAFDWEEALNFEGNSTPYLQYSYVRACNILKKLKKEKKKAKANYENVDEKEYTLAKQLDAFPSVASDALDQLKIHLLCNYTYKLCQIFNDFYETCSVIRAKPKDKARRLELVRATKQVLANVLNLIGIPLVEAM